MDFCDKVKELPFDVFNIIKEYSEYEIEYEKDKIQMMKEICQFKAVISSPPSTDEWNNKLKKYVKIVYES